MLKRIRAFLPEYSSGLMFALGAYVCFAICSIIVVISSL